MKKNARANNKGLSQARALAKAKAYIKRVVHEFFGSFTLIETFLNICGDIMTDGVWPDETPLDAVHNVGELRAISGWWTSETIILHLMMTTNVRGLRAYFQQRFGINLDQQPLEETSVIMELFSPPIDERVHQSLPSVLMKLKKKYGDIPADSALIKAFMDKEAEVVKQFQADPKGFIDTLRAAASATKH